MRPPMRQRKLKRCPWTGVRDRPDASTVGLDDGTGDRQPQPGAVRLRGEVRVEDLVSPLAGQSHAGVVD